MSVLSVLAGPLIVAAAGITIYDALGDLILSIGSAIAGVLGALAVFLPALRKFRQGDDDEDDPPARRRPRRRTRHRR